MSAGDHYWLVSALNSAGESALGFDTRGVAGGGERDAWRPSRGKIREQCVGFLDAT
jgi:hypothetical protein